MLEDDGFFIGQTPIGKHHKPAVIVELGINHGGSLERALSMASSALDAGAKIIKHQTHSIHDEMSNEARDIVPANATESIWSVIQNNSLSEHAERELQSYVLSRGGTYISTPFSRSAVDRLMDLDVPAIKIGSGECNNLPLLHYIAQTGKPLILSTGMNDIDSIRRSTELLASFGCPVALLHCTNLYPTPPHLVRLGGIAELMDAFPGCPVGFSDHSDNPHVAIAAIALGAQIVERHFVDTRAVLGPDVSSSMDVDELRALLEAAEVLQDAKGGGVNPVSEERVTADFAFASVAAIRDIAPGEVLSRENIWVMRPSGGDFPAEEYEAVLGSTAITHISKGFQIQRKCIRRD